MSELNLPQLRKIEALIAEHAFGFRWFLFTSDKEPHEKWCSLLQPATWIERHGGVPIEFPTPGILLDVDVPAYARDSSLMRPLIEKCLEHDPEHPIAFHKTFTGYCCGDVQGPHYADTQIALAMHSLRVFKIEI